MPNSPSPATNRERLEQAHGEAAWRAGTRSDLGRWAEAALPEGQSPAVHHRLLIDALHDVACGRHDRLMVLMPPGSAKSTYASVLFPVWWFVRNPNTSVIACSHTASLAEAFAGRVRGLLAEFGHRVGAPMGGKRVRHDFQVADHGTYYATGVRGAVTGRRADLILIDDPVKSSADASSAAGREALWHWYCNDLLTRLKPGGRVVLIMTRWHTDDLGGRLLDRDHGWHCLRLPALAEQDDPMGRAAGAPLWPDYFDGAALERKRAAMGEHQWSALYQQSPTPPGGLMFHPERIELVPYGLPVTSVRGWDLAATSAERGGNPDWTVGVKLGREASGRYVVLDVVRLRGSPLEVEAAVRQTAQEDGVHIPISLPQDPGQAGVSQMRYMVSQLSGYTVIASAETGSKQLRATPVATQVEARNVAMVRGPWNSAMLEELRLFPHAGKDDQVDALSRAFNFMVTNATKTAAHRRELPIISR